MLNGVRGVVEKMEGGRDEGCGCQCVKEAMTRFLAMRVERED